MSTETMTYRVTEIPDRFYPQYQIIGGGEVLRAVARDFENLLRVIAHLSPASAFVSIIFEFNPAVVGQGIQFRLNIFLKFITKETGIKESLRLFVERGPLTRFYPFEPVGDFQGPQEKSLASIEIVRRESAVAPLYSSEFNDRIPECYYTIDPFIPNHLNDFLDLDRMLAGIREPVFIEIVVSSADVSSELKIHTEYLSRLQAINRPWDMDPEEAPGIMDYFTDSNRWQSNEVKKHKPLRYRDPLADDMLRTQQRFHETLRQPHLHFSIRAFSRTSAVAKLVGSIVAESAFEDGSYRLLSFKNELKHFDKEDLIPNQIGAFPFPPHGSFDHHEKRPYCGLARLSHLATVSELSGIFRLPVASLNSPSCIRKNTDPPHESHENCFPIGSEYENKDLVRSITTDVLPKHLALFGVSGVGKTTLAQRLMVELYRNNVPFLIIETVKTEYRQIKTYKNHPDKAVRSLAKDLEIYSPGNENVSPCRLNPMEFPCGISRDQHIDNLLSCFMAAMPISGPLPAILGEGLERVYEEFPNRDTLPMMCDLISSTGKVLEEKEYSPETNSDIRAALEVRLGVLTRRSIGKVFQCRHSIPSIEHLLKVPAIIELDALATEQACLLTLFLLTNLREHLKLVPAASKNLRYMVFIEEAHNVVASTEPALASADIANPKAFASEYICRMLAEMRALGVGMVIVDQFPSAIAPEVIKSTTTKIAFRQVAKSDREELGESMLFTETEMEDIARLRTGAAFFITEGYHRPRGINTVNFFK